MGSYVCQLQYPLLLFCQPLGRNPIDAQDGPHMPHLSSMEGMSDPSKILQSKILPSLKAFTWVLASLSSWSYLPWLPCCYLGWTAELIYLQLSCSKGVIGTPPVPIYFIRLSLKLFEQKIKSKLKMNAK